MNTKIQYLYRDAHNFKKFAEVVVFGLVDGDQLFSLLKDGMFFIPSYVGLESLQEKPLKSYDHVWHELESVVPTNDPASVTIDSKTIQTFFHKAHKDGWDETMAFREMELL